MVNIRQIHSVLWIVNSRILESVSTNFVHLFNFCAANLSGEVREFFSVWNVVTWYINMS